MADDTFRPPRGLSLARLMALPVLLLTGILVGRLLGGAVDSPERFLASYAERLRTAVRAGDADAANAALNDVVRWVPRVRSPHRQARALGPPRPDTEASKHAGRFHARGVVVIEVGASLRLWDFEGLERDERVRAVVLGWAGSERVGCVGQVIVYGPDGPEQRYSLPAVEEARTARSMDVDDFAELVASGLGGLAGLFVWIVAWLRRRRAA